jgi:hypothetical protein
MRCSGSCRQCRISWRQAKAAAQQAQQTQQAQQQQAQQIQQAQNIPATIPPNLYAADVPVPTKGAPSWFDSIHVSMAGTFVAMEGAWRQRNENSSGATDPPFSTIPLLNSPLYNENEQRFSAQQSRIAFKASGDVDPARHQHGLASEQQHRLPLAPLLSVQLSGTVQKGLERAVGPAGGAFCFGLEVYQSALRPTM